ncbi:MAG TPA: alpha/beta hydrolase [Polyangiaceae bacterium]|jgi:pimeloyl-ACP methyl ester carboxylesterase|nr:alpha/beta hydrolase [Polyangiaceae bacterium]
MILNRVQVEQAIDGDRVASFIKEIVLARPRTPDGHRPDVPLALVRKRSARAFENGAKAPLLLIHGYGQNRYAWHLPARSFVNYLADEGYDVFNLDLRGHGRSRHLGARPPKDLNEYVREDVPAAVDTVRRLSGHERVFLVGHSLGGLISYAAAPAIPDHIGGIVTIGSPYHFTRGSRFLSLIGSGMLAADRTLQLGHRNVPLKAMGEAMRLLRVFIESPLFPLPIRGFAPRSLEPRIHGQHMSLAMDIGSIAVMRSMFLRAAEARASGHRLGVLYGYAAAFEALDIPLLVIAGDQDGLAPLEAVRPAYERSSSADKTFRSFPRGHIDLLVGREAPLTIWPLVLSWLNTRVRRQRQPVRECAVK